VTPEEAFDRYHEPVFRFAYRLTRRADRAEDLTQECFLAYVRAPGRVDTSRGNTKTYLFAIVRNLAFKYYRDALPEGPLDDRAVGQFNPELATAVEEAVASLPPLQQEAILLFEYEGFTLDEIAQVTGADTGTIKSRLHRARESLKRILAPYRKESNAHGTAR
jgi:RNA polymerase sigma-70 factor (ECF subfamily)